MPHIRHIIWDWNGTLLADTGLTVKAARAAMAAIGRPVDLTVEKWRGIATRPITATYETLNGGPLVSAQWKTLTDAWLDTYLSGQSEAGLHATARAALDEVTRRGVTQSIVSLHIEDELRAHAEALGVSDCFTQISGWSRGWGDLNAHASKAEVMRRQLAAVGVDPQEALVIGDMEDDGAEARQAGLAATLVTTGDTSTERLLASGFPVADCPLSAVQGRWLN